MSDSSVQSGSARVAAHRRGHGVQRDGGEGAEHDRRDWTVAVVRLIGENTARGSQYREDQLVRAGVEQSGSARDFGDVNLKVATVRLVENAGNLIRKCGRGASHVLQCSRQEAPPVAIVGKDDLRHVWLNDGEWIPARIKLGTQPNDQEQRAPEQHPVLRHLERRRQLPEGYIESAQVSERLQAT